MKMDKGISATHGWSAPIVNNENFEGPRPSFHIQKVSENISTHLGMYDHSNFYVLRVLIAISSQLNARWLC